MVLISTVVDVATDLWSMTYGLRVVLISTVVDAKNFSAEMGPSRFESGFNFYCCRSKILTLRTDFSERFESGFNFYCCRYLTSSEFVEH